MASVLVLTFFMSCFGWGFGKIYERCELAKELSERFQFPKEHLSKWLCLANWESNYNTKAVHKGSFSKSLDHGIFQINDALWCSTGFQKTLNGCNMPCHKFRDDDIADDIECVKIILQTYGFDGWVSNRMKCSGDTSQYYAGCDFTSRSLPLTYPPEVFSLDPPLVSSLPLLPPPVLPPTPILPPILSSSPILPPILSSPPILSTSTFVSHPPPPPPPPKKKPKGIFLDLSLPPTFIKFKNKFFNGYLNIRPIFTISNSLSTR